MKKKTRKTKQSKYLTKTFGEWICTHCGVDYVSSKNQKSFGTKHYYYIFERLTHDDKAFKMIRLNASQAALVWKGKRTVESYLDKKLENNNVRFKDYISYNFIREE